jgi:polar amino acid transport system permease protein
MFERKRSYLIDIFVALIGIVCAALLVVSIRKLDYDWNFSFLAEYVWNSENNSPGLLLQGLWGTIWVSVVSILLGSMLGTFLGAALCVKNPTLQIALQAYVELVRNTPLLVQLYVVYFALGNIFEFSAEEASLITLTGFSAAYLGDIVRGGISQFDKGQLDAGKMIGLNSFQIGIHVAAPQIFKRLLPSYLAQAVSLVKDTSLVSVVSMVELTKAALNIVSTSFRSFETWFVIAAIYFALNYSLSLLGKWMESKLGASARGSL